jgi:hypothetical protein
LIVSLQFAQDSDTNNLFSNFEKACNLTFITFLQANPGQNTPLQAAIKPIKLQQISILERYVPQTQTTFPRRLSVQPPPTAPPLFSHKLIIFSSLHNRHSHPFKQYPYQIQSFI